MNYYKITNRDELHGNMQYRDGLNINVEPFNPKGDCTDGGIYFAREDILAFLDCGIWLRKVTLPENPEVYENPGRPKKWKTHKVFLGSKVKITSKVIERLILEGANPNIDNSFPLRWALMRENVKNIKILLPLSNLSPKSIYIESLVYAKCTGHKEITKLLTSYIKQRGIKNEL